jgi:hypothetical protein
VLSLHVCYYCHDSVLLQASTVGVLIMQAHTLLQVLLLL